MWPSMYIRYSRKTASNIHIEIHESLIIKVAKLLTLVNMITSTAKVAWPLMSTLSIYICANSSIVGTGLSFLSRSGVSDKVFLVMVQHVILLNQTLQKMVQECSQLQHWHKANILCDIIYENFLAYQDEKRAGDKNNRRLCAHRVTSQGRRGWQGWEYFSQAFHQGGKTDTRVVLWECCLKVEKLFRSHPQPCHLGSSNRILWISCQLLWLHSKHHCHEGWQVKDWWKQLPQNVLNLSTEISSSDFISYMNDNACNPSNLYILPNSSWKSPTFPLRSCITQSSLTKKIRSAFLF